MLQAIRQELLLLLLLNHPRLHLLLLLLGLPGCLLCCYQRPGLQQHLLLLQLPCR
jgi:hypothetical protein